VTPNLATYTAAVNVQVPEADKAKIDPDHEKDLRWYFQHSDSEALARFALYSRPTWQTADVETGMQDFISVSRPKWFRMREILRSMPEPHADVLGWCFEQREYLRSSSKAPEMLDYAPDTDVFRGKLVDIHGADNDVVESADDDPEFPSRKRRKEQSASPHDGLMPGSDVDGPIPYWECEPAQKDHAFLSKVGEWPGVATRTMAAYRAISLDETMERIDPERIEVDGEGRVSHGSRFVVVTGDHPVRRGMVGFIGELPTNSIQLAAIKAETRKRVRAAFDAYAKAAA